MAESTATPTPGPAKVGDPEVRAERVRRLITRMVRESPGVPFSKQLPEDDWGGHYTAGLVIEPPINPLYLAEESQYSATLATGQCVMVTNVHAMGHQWDPDATQTTDDDKAAAKTEAEGLDAQLADLCPEHGWLETRTRVGGDFEGVGWAGIEVLRDNEPNPDTTKMGNIVQLIHVPAHSFRLCRQDRDFKDAFFWKYDAAGEGWKVQTYRKRFRKFVQMPAGRLRYFKEFGDPRDLDFETGQYMKGGTMPPDRRATELLYLAQYTPGTPYGTPRWWPGFLAIEGGRKADELNVHRLDNNGIPPLLILMLGASLADGAWDDYVNWWSQVRGKEGYCRPLFMEAEKVGADSPLATGGTKPPDVEVIKLADLMASDAMFLEYSKQCDERVRTCFRFGDMYYGRSSAQNFATAQVELALAQSQVFGPEQNRFDWVVNTRILPECRIKPTRNSFRSKGPVLKDGEQWLKAADMAFRYGLIVSQDAGARLLEEALGTTLPRSDQPWAALPFVLAQVLMTAGAFTAEGELDPTFDEPPPEPVPSPFPAGAAPAEVPGQGTGKGPGVEGAETGEGEPVAKLLRWTRAMVRRAKAGNDTQAEVVAEAVLRALLRLKAEANGTATRDWSDPKPPTE